MMSTLIASVIVSFLLVGVAGIIHEHILSSNGKQVWWKFGVLCLIVWVLIARGSQALENNAGKADSAATEAYNDGYYDGFEDGEASGINRLQEKFERDLEDLAAFPLDYGDIEYEAYTYGEIAEAVKDFQEEARRLRERILEYK